MNFIMGHYGGELMRNDGRNKDLFFRWSIIGHFPHFYV